jgi:predicted Zn finger-like uncharacterized protein
MPIPIVCPSCAAKLRVPDNMAGRKTKCPKCGTGINVPSQGILEPITFSAQPQSVDPVDVEPVFQPDLAQREAMTDNVWKEITQAEKYRQEQAEKYRQEMQARPLHRTRSISIGGLAKAAIILGGLLSLILLLALAVSFWTKPQTFRERADKIQNGMSHDRVIEIMQEDGSLIFAARGHEHYVWRGHDGGSWVDLWIEFDHHDRVYDIESVMD